MTRRSIDEDGSRSLEDALRQWAKGSHPLEAGVELLVRHRKAVVREGAPWIERSGDHASIDAEVLLYESGAWSSGERKMVRIAASLLGGPPVDLSEDVPGLDRDNLQLVLEAIAHANGGHQRYPGGAANQVGQSRATLDGDAHS